MWSMVMHTVRQTVIRQAMDTEPVAPERQDEKGKDNGHEDGQVR